MCISTLGMEIRPPPGRHTCTSEVSMTYVKPSVQRFGTLKELTLHEGHGTVSGSALHRS
jgi:hypothetical protein